MRFPQISSDEVDITKAAEYISAVSAARFKIFNSEHTDVYGNALFTVEKITL